MRQYHSIIVMARLDRATRRGTVPLRVARSSWAMTKRQIVTMIALPP